MSKLESEFREFIILFNKNNGVNMAKNKVGGTKNPAIKSGNLAFKPTNNGSTLPKGSGGKLNSKIWRGSSRGK